MDLTSILFGCNLNETKWNVGLGIYYIIRLALKDISRDSHPEFSFKTVKNLIE